MSLPKDIVDDQERPVSLLKLLGRGGEGAVYEVLGDPTKAAKIYFPDKAVSRRDKVLAMIGAQLQNGATGVAYPIKPLFHSNGLFAGFTMEKIKGRKPVHELYSPSSRRTKFVKADFRFLVRTAINLSNSVAAVHASGCVIGDINHSGIFISEDALTTLIDADSFQFRFGKNVYRCIVGTEDFTPPEIQGKRPDQIELTPNHDSFGLCVIIFMLLFMGRHPFIGDYLGGGSLPYDKAIRECRFAFSRDRKRTGMEPPPHLPCLDDLPPSLANAFEIAFGPSSLRGGRPTAADWVRLLKTSEAELVRCQSSPAHHFFKNAKSCPWCRMERGFPGFVAFATPIQVNSSAPADLAQLIAAIRAVPDPGTAAPFVSCMPIVQITRTSPRPSTNEGISAFLAATVGALISIPLLTTQTVNPLWAFCGFVGCAYAALRSPASNSSAPRPSDTLRKGFSLHEERYRTVADNRRFLEVRQTTESEVGELGELSREEAKQIADLSLQLRELQLQYFLDRFQISHAKIKGLGSGRKATLRSYGIETAAHVTSGKIESISGFGPATSALLLSWRSSLEKRFVFNPAQPVNPADVARVKNLIAQRRTRLEQTLRARLTELRTVSAEILQSRGTIVGHAASIWRDLKQVEFDGQIAPALTNISKRRWLFSALALTVFGVSVSLNYKGSLQSTAPNQAPATVAAKPPIQSPTLPQIAQTIVPARPSGAQTAQSLPSPVFPPLNPPAYNWPQNGDQKPDSSKAASPSTGPLALSAEDQKSPAPANNISTPPEAIQPPLERSDATFISDRLNELGYLDIPGSTNITVMKQAIRDIKIVNGLPSNDTIDAATIRLLNFGSPLSAQQSFLGGWSTEPTCSQGVELQVSSAIAKTDAGLCRLNRISLGVNMWKVQARCEVGADAWPANITFKVLGRRLEWSSEKGKQNYYRCR